jgi:hypothetical protein
VEPDRRRRRLRQPAPVHLHHRPVPHRRPAPGLLDLEFDHFSCTWPLEFSTDFDQRMKILRTPRSFSKVCGSVWFLKMILEIWGVRVEIFMLFQLISTSAICTRDMTAPCPDLTGSFFFHDNIWPAQYLATILFKWPVRFLAGTVFGHHNSWPVQHLTSTTFEQYHTQATLLAVGQLHSV